MNGIVEYLDHIQESAIDAEVNVCLALAEAYVKQLKLISESDTDISEFPFYQEADTPQQPSQQQPQNTENKQGVLDQAKGNANENIVKRVLLFIPRLVKALFMRVVQVFRNMKKNVQATEQAIDANKDAYVGKTFKFELMADLQTKSLAKQFGLISTYKHDGTDESVPITIAMSKTSVDLGDLTNHINEANYWASNKDEVQRVTSNIASILVKVNTSLRSLPDVKKVPASLTCNNAEDAKNFLKNVDAMYSQFLGSISQSQKYFDGDAADIQNANPALIDKPAVVKLLTPLTKLLESLTKLVAELGNFQQMDVLHIQKVLGINPDGQVAKPIDTNNFDVDNIKAEWVENDITLETLTKVAQPYAKQGTGVLFVQLFNENLPTGNKTIDLLRKKFPMEQYYNPIAVWVYEYTKDTNGKVKAQRSQIPTVVCPKKSIDRKLVDLFNKNKGRLKMSDIEAI